MPDADALRDRFDPDSPPTVGLEEEVMLLDPVNYDLLPRAREVVEAANVEFVKGEMPASQLEVLTSPARSVNEVAQQIYQRRESVARAASGIGVFCAAGAHPFAPPEGLLATGERYAAMAREYGTVARRQLICALQVHVAIRPAATAVAVYNALRSYLPELAALAANAPFHAGVDSGLASVRPKLSELLPRQGIPPPLVSIDQLAEDLGWARRAGALDDSRQWWWELRLNTRYGTVEVRVPDAQTTVNETVAVAAVIHCLCVQLAERHHAGELPRSAADWRIAQNRWAACRHGLDATLADLETAERLPARERIAGLLDKLKVTADRLGCQPQLQRARTIVEGPGAPATHRHIAAQDGLDGLVRWMADRFLLPPADGVDA